MGKTAYTKITPLPSNIPRRLALELLHSHEEVIRLNPLVTGVRAIEAPRDAATDEYYSQWYEISQIITWGLGLKSKYSFRGVFHDQPWGLQTHVYAPMGVDMRNKYRIGGNQPGEPREARELGVDTPLDGLYLREDVEISCNMAMISFVKKEAKEATGIMIQRLTRKAELLDEGKLHAMFEDGKLKTSRPTNMFGGEGGIGSPNSISPPGSPGLMYSPDGRLGGGGASPAMSHASFGGGGAHVDARGYGKYHDVARRSGYGNGGTPPMGQAGLSGQPGMPMINELPGSTDFKSQTAFRSELPGDVSFGAYPPTGPGDGANHPGQRQSGYVAYPGQAIGTQDSNRLSAATTTTDSWSQARSSIASSVVPDPSGASSKPSDPANLQQRFGQMALTPEPLHPHPSPSPNSNRNSYAQPPTTKPSSPTPREHRRQSTSSSTNWSLPLRSPVQTQAPAGFGSSPGPPQQQSEKVAPVTGTSAAKCPVCGLFEGDEAAVSHHVSRTHFA